MNSFRNYWREYKIYLNIKIQLRRKAAKLIIKDNNH